MKITFVLLTVAASVLATYVATHWPSVKASAAAKIEAIDKAMTVEPKSPVQELGPPSKLTLKSDHVSIVKTGIFYDVNAYEHTRCSYEITDLKTGRRYIGVSGIGIVELNSYNDGENMKQVE